MSTGAVTGSSWFQRVTGQSRPAAPAAPSQPRTRQGGGGTPSDRAQLSGRGVSRSDILRDARSSVTSFFGSLSSGVESVGQGGSRLVQGFSDFVGRRVGEVATAPGRVASAVTNVGSRAVAGVLELQGNERGAQAVRRAGRAATNLLDSNNERAARMTSNFVSGVGDGVGGLVEGIGTAVAHPVQTLEGLNRLNQLVNPIAQTSAMAVEVANGRSPLNVYRQNMETVTGIVNGVREDYRRTGQDHGTEGQVGRAAFDILSTVLTGGESAAGRAGLRVATNSLDDFARASRAVRAGETVAETSRAGRAGSVAGRVLPGGIGERVTRASEALRDAGVARAERQIANTRAQGARRAEGLDPRAAEGTAGLRPVRQRANALRDELPANQGMWEAGGAQRDELIGRLPSQQQARVRQLEAEGRGADALEVIQRHHVEESIRGNLDDLGRLDERFPVELPADLDPSRVLAQGRRGSLEFLLNDASLSADALRRNFRHIVNDSDVLGPVYVREFRAGDQVGRAFSTSAGRESGITSKSFMEGGYYGEAGDAMLSRSQIQARNALGLDNHADRFARFTVPENTYAVTSRIGEQYGYYGGHAVGGNWQFTFPGQVQPLLPTVTDVGRFSRNTQRTLNGIVGAEVAGNWGADISAEEQ